jgi:hypothetical protein
MIGRSHALPVTRQCQILSLARSTAYYRPQKAGEADLGLLPLPESAVSLFLVYVSKLNPLTLFHPNSFIIQHCLK